MASVSRSHVELVMANVKYVDGLVPRIRRILEGSDLSTM